MSDEASVIVGADGRPARRDDRCPQCHAGKNRRTNTAGFGEPVICCGVCGYEFPAGTEYEE